MKFCKWLLELVFNYLVPQLGSAVYVIELDTTQFLLKIVNIFAQFVFNAAK